MIPCLKRCVLIPQEMEDNVSLRDLIDMPRFLLRFASLSGVILSERVKSFYAEGLHRRSAFQIRSVDVEGFSSRCSYTRFIDSSHATLDSIL